MKATIKLLSGLMLLSTLTACGSDTVIHERPVVVQTAPSAYMAPGSVERKCENGYDNATHSCY